MALWRRLFGTGSGGAATRTEGLQIGSPSSYASNPALPVTVDTAMATSAVWACVKLYAETIGSLPIKIYEKKADGSRVESLNHPLAELFSGKINRWQTRNEFFECLTYQQVLLGNSYSLIQRGTGGRIVGLVPLMSDQMQVGLDENDNIVYDYRTGRKNIIYSNDVVWHNKMMGNGIIGLSPLAYARNPVGIGQAAESAVTKIYANGGKPSGVLSVDRILTDEQRNKIKQGYAEMTDGNENRLYVLEAAMDFKQISLSPQDIELLASRRFQIEEIARYFGVPSVLINDTASTTSWGSGIQQLVEGWYKLGLRPVLERFQESMEVWLLSPQDRVRFDIEFDLSELLQPSFAERVKTHKEAVQGGIMTPNEARLCEGMQPKEGGDSLFMQQQMLPIEQLETLNRTGQQTPVA